jgi:hypothetical protein
MMYGPVGFGHGLAGVLGAIVGFLGSLILLAIVIAVLFFLIRFLIIGTKAAQLYLDTNRPAKPLAPVTEPVESPAASSIPTPAVATPPPPPKPVVKPRGPRTPPPVA